MEKQLHRMMQFVIGCMNLAIKIINIFVTLQPAVFIDKKVNTAIIVGKNGKKLPVIKFGKGKLTVTSLSSKEIMDQGYAANDYLPKLAALSSL